MATVISSQKIGDRPQKNGSRYVRYKFVCEANDSSTQDVFIGPKLVPSDFDTDADIAALEPVILSRLAKEEGDTLEDINFIEDPLPLILSPKWGSTKYLASRILRWMMREKDPRIVIYLEPLIEYIQTNYNATQIANLLDMTTEQVIRLNNRVKAVLDPPVVAASIKYLISVFDAEEDDI